MRFSNFSFSMPVHLKMTDIESILTSMLLLKCQYIEIWCSSSTFCCHSSILDTNQNNALKRWEQTGNETRRKKNLPELSKQALSKIKTTRRNPKKNHKIFNYFYEPVLTWVVLDRFIRLDQLIKVRINNMEQTWSQLISQCWLIRFTPSSARLFKLSKYLRDALFRIRIRH